LPDFAPGKLFQMGAKHFQIRGRFLQIFPKIPLAVLWEIKGLQEEKGKFRFAPNFCADPRRKPPRRPAVKARMGTSDKAA
jgi:hypothetical protein